jgi:hypothetical protein
MPLISYAEYRPDVSDYMSQHSAFMQNAIPRGDGYGPLQSLQPFSTALPSAARGSFKALRGDGSVTVFAATATDLWTMNNTTSGWTNVSKSGSYNAVPPQDNWQFAQFNNFVFAVQVNTPMQVFDLRGSTKFSDSLGNPPPARYISVVSRFIVLSGLLGTPFRIQWSGLNDVNSATSWTPGINLADFQDLADGGVVRGVAGGEFGVIFQDFALRRMTFMPGSPVVFQIDKLVDDVGLFAPYSLIRTNSRIFFLAPFGFMGMGNTDSAPSPIGKERVDRTVLGAMDKTNLQLVLGASDPESSRIFWAYKTTSGTAGLFDKIIGYDWALDRWFPVTLTGEYLGGMSQPGITLESLDLISPSIDTLPQSLDSYVTSVIPEISAFDSAHRLNFFRGPNLETMLDTPEQAGDGTRFFVRGFRVISDAPSVFGSASARETQNATPFYSPESAINSLGNIDLRVDTRFTRSRVRIPAGTAWTVSRGVEPDLAPMGQK